MLSIDSVVCSLLHTFTSTPFSHSGLCHKWVRDILYEVSGNPPSSPFSFISFPFKSPLILMTVLKIIYCLYQQFYFIIYIPVKFYAWCLRRLTSLGCISNKFFFWLNFSIFIKFLTFRMLDISIIIKQGTFKEPWILYGIPLNTYSLTVPITALRSMTKGAERIHSCKEGVCRYYS